MLANYLPYKKIHVVYKHESFQKIVPQLDIQIKQVIINNVNDILSYKGKSYAREYKNNLKKGYTGFYAYLDSKVIGHAWGTINLTNKIQKVRGYFKLPQDSAFIFHCAVHPDYRGKKIYQTLLINLYNRLYSIGAQSIYIDTDMNNIPSQKAIEKTGCGLQYTVTLWSIRSKPILCYKNNYYEVAKR
jgi:predicted acetyltransferase